jgi:DNA replicative helicase MCM subunit Mcm2 (Cdc46/Mcm family)
MVNSVAPRVFGHEELKRGMLLSFLHIHYMITFL